MDIFKIFILVGMAIAQLSYVDTVRLSKAASVQDRSTVVIQRVRPQRFESIILIEQGDVIMSNTLPRYGLICEPGTYVHGNPQGDYPLYILEPGAQVRLREMYSTYNKPAWVMIKPAEWIPLTALCGR